MPIKLIGLVTVVCFLGQSCGRSPQGGSNKDTAEVRSDSTAKLSASLVSLAKSSTGRADSLTIKRYGLASNAQQESKTFHLVPDPLIFNGSRGDVMLMIQQEYFTIVRAPLTTGGYRCYMTFNSLWTTGRWRTHFNNNPGMHIFFQVLNAQHGLLINWDLGRIQTECGWAGQPIAFSSDFDPNVYNLIADGVLYFDATPFFNCR